MSLRLAIAAGAVGVGLIAYAVLSAETDEEKILARLDQLEDAVRVDEETSNPILRLGRVRGQFSEIFTEDVTFSIPELTSAHQGRKTLADLAAKAGTSVRTFDVDFTHVDVSLTGSGTGATVSAVAELTATRSTGRPERDERRVRFEFLNGDDGWQVADLRASGPDAR